MTSDANGIRAMRNRALAPGMRHYRSWLRSTLPDRSSPTDIDFVLHNGKTERCLWIEFKASTSVSNGQLRLFRLLCARGDVVLVVVDPTTGRETEEHSLERSTELRVALVSADVRAPLLWERTTVESLDRRCVEFMNEGRLAPARATRPTSPGPASVRPRAPGNASSATRTHDHKAPRR